MVWDAPVLPPEVGEGPASIVGDADGNGELNILDLVLVASIFGDAEENAPADINGDGQINTLDLIAVASALGGVTAAAPAHSDMVMTLNAADVKQWLIQARELELADAVSQKGVRYLEQLLTVLRPMETALLPNYPNPFNPETWIPYHLAEDASVRLTIHDVNGKLVRHIDLGHQAAGFYTGQIHAAYWDGHNRRGEVMASGVYFYTLYADGFAETRKMFIQK